MKKRTSFIKFIQLWGIIFLLAIGGSIVALDVIVSYREFHVQAEQMRSDYITQKKEMIKQEVDRVVAMINHEKAQIEAVAKEKIKSRVNEAYAIVQNIHRQYKTAKSKHEIQQMILTVLRSMLFEKETGYYFVIRLDGLVMLNTNKPELEGKNLLSLQDTHGKNFIKEMIKIARQSGEGFDEYYWAKPGMDGTGFKKNSFIKAFEPYNWIIGTGLYVDDVEEQIKNTLLSTISRIRFGKEGYIFINRLNGDALVSNGKLFSGTKKLWEVFNKNPKKIKDIFEKEYYAALKPDGDYIYYLWIKLTTLTIESPKASFIFGIPEFQWLVGAGVYLDDVEKDIALVQTELNNQIKMKIIYFIMIVIGILSLFLILFRRVNRKLENDFNLFTSFFNSAACSDNVINRELVQFVELDRMAKYANKMLSDRKQAEEKQKSDETFLNAIVENIPNMIFVKDAENLRFVRFNKAGENIIGYSREDMIGKNDYDFFSKEEADFFTEKDKEVLAKGALLDIAEEQIQTKYKGERILHTQKIPLLGRKGQPEYLLGISEDITERKKLEERLRQSQKMESIGTLAGGIAHDFNNILFPVLGHTEMLLQDIPKNSQTHNSLKKIYSGAIRASELVKQILTFSRQENYELKLIKIQPIIKETLKLIRSTIPTTINIKQDIKANCGLVTADPTQIHQIIMNLATNAYHAMEETGGELKVSLKEIELDEHDVIAPEIIPGVYACLTISDTGVGMDKDLTEKIFDPFFTTKEIGKGTGMGLSVVHGIIKSMNGVIKVYSEPGEGTQFHVYLPVEKNLSDEQVIHSKIEIQGGTEQILLVDDEKAILSMERQMLERLGYQVTSRVSSIEALEAFRDSPDKFDLVITDMAMPNMPGDQFAVESVKIRPDIPILICTGFSETMSKEKAASLGIKGFLWKPIIMKDLAQKIREVLE